MLLSSLRGILFNISHILRLSGASSGVSVGAIGEPKILFLRLVTISLKFRPPSSLSLIRGNYYIFATACQVSLKVSCLLKISVGSLL